MKGTQGGFSSKFTLKEVKWLAPVVAAGSAAKDLTSTLDEPEVEATEEQENSPNAPRRALEALRIAIQ